MDEVDSDWSSLSDEDLDDLEDAQILEVVQEQLANIFPLTRRHVMDRMNPLEMVPPKSFL